MGRTGTEVTGSGEGLRQQEVAPWGELQPGALTWAGSEGHHLRGRKGTWFFGLVVMRKIRIGYINLARAFILFGF